MSADDVLTGEQKRALLEIARMAVQTQVLGVPAPAPDRAEASAAVTLFPAADGAFVTIRRRGELRGCLGTLRCAQGLEAEIARCAADAASEDPRFHPVSADELPELSIEVSVLGPLEAIDPADDGAIVLGRHGLVVEQGSRRGLLLPQVAIEWGWTVEQFLRQTCVKARLAPDAWRQGARVYRFAAEVFGDADR